MSNEVPENNELIIPEFVRSGLYTYVGPWALQWLDDELPGILATCKQQWGLEYEGVFDGGSSAVVVAARRNDISVALKIFPKREHFPHELAALNLWSEKGMPKLIESDEKLAVLLQERIVPGTSMENSPDVPPKSAAKHAAAVLKRLQQPSPPAAMRRTLRELLKERSDWTHNLINEGIADPRFDMFRVWRAEQLVEALLNSATRSVVVHGDYYPSNLLHGIGKRWVAIDSQSATGDPCFDAASWCYGNGRGKENTVSLQAVVFARELGLSVERIEAWAVAIGALNLVSRMASGHASEEEITSTLSFVDSHPLFSRDPDTAAQAFKLVGPANPAIAPQFGDHDGADGSLLQ